MKKLGATGRRWLKGFHVFFVCVWIGAGVCLTVMNLALSPEEGQGLYGMDVAMKFIDDFLIIPGALGCLLTGLLISIFTNWGFFKHTWVTVKWVITVGGILFGTFWLGPWLNSLPPVSRAEGIAALSNASYIHAKAMNSWFGTIQVLTLVFAMFISVFKPWKRRNRTPTGC